MSFEDWFNLGFSLSIVLAAYLIGSWAIHWLFPLLFHRTKTDLNDSLLQVSGNELRWLVVELILRFATNCLGFINTDLKTAIADIYFLLILFLVIVILWRLINLAASEVSARAKKNWTPEPSRVADHINDLELAIFRNHSRHFCLADTFWGQRHRFRSFPGQHRPGYITGWA